MFTKPLFSDTAPNITPRHTMRALSYMLLPWKWMTLRSGDWNNRVEHELKDLFSSPHNFFFYC